MKKILIFGLILIIVVVSSVIIIHFYPKSTATNPVTTQIGQPKISICDLMGNPALYSDKIVSLEADVKFIGENYYAQKGNFFLEDNGCQIQVESWASTTVGEAPPGINNKPPATMSSYMDKKVTLTGTLKQLPKQEYINQQWTTTGTYYSITSVSNVAIVH